MSEVMITELSTGNVTIIRHAKVMFDGDNAFIKKDGNTMVRGTQFHNIDVYELDWGIVLGFIVLLVIAIFAWILFV